MYRPFLAVAGLLGALGVATAAAASHGGDTNLGIVGNFLLFHAPALIGLSLLPRSRLITIAGYVLMAGLALFCGDLAMRSFTGNALFPMAAPTGGGGLILGWLLVAASPLFTRRT
ncbi:MAG: DUF423 domain-containing protein [Alphaproteobacteria bacterium]|nr:MAG: DUF423 domain-containing protein [Alphaproteobacteria bacterium]